LTIHCITWRQEVPEPNQTDAGENPVVDFPISLLRPGFSPRLAGLDDQNVRILAEVDDPLPPLLVRRGTNQVIDGMHRLYAAKVRGERSIAVRFHDCAEADAFVLAVRANVTHGLPLSLGDRKAAAQRILRSHINWSDRRIAAVTGLSDKTVAVIRGRSRPVGDLGEDLRIGLDGRTRPVDASIRRAEVTRLVAGNPNSSLRQIAGQAGVSPETVRSVRSALADGRTREPVRMPRRNEAKREPRQCLRALAGDPALRSTDAGRQLLRILSTLTALEQDPGGLVDSVPGHSLPLFRTLALANAELWRALEGRAAARERHAHVEAAPVLGAA